MKNANIRRVANTPELAAQFADIWLNQPEKTTDDLARCLGLGHRSNTARVAKMLGLPKRKIGRKPIAFSDKMRSEIIEGRQARVPEKVLRYQLGLSPRTYYRAIHELGLALRGKPA